MGCFCNTDLSQKHFKNWIVDSAEPQKMEIGKKIAPINILIRNARHQLRTSGCEVVEGELPWRDTHGECLVLVRDPNSKPLPMLNIIYIFT